MAAIVILVAVIMYLGYLLWKRRKEKGYLFSPPPPPRPAHEVALEALEVLYRSSLLEDKQYKESYESYLENYSNISGSMDTKMGYCMHTFGTLVLGTTAVTVLFIAHLIIN